MKASGLRTVAISLLVGLATLPDGMVPIALNAAVVERWGVSLQTAHWFTAAALLGAVALFPLLGPIQRRWKAGASIAWASLINAILLILLACPIPFWLAMILRIGTGGMDMVTLAILLGLLEGGDRTRSGRRYGPATLAIMLGLAMGFTAGGILSQFMQAGIFLVGASFSILLAVAAGCSGGLIRDEAMELDSPTGGVRYWPTLLFSFSDRALSAVVTVSVTLYLVKEIAVKETLVGPSMSMILLIIALGAWPAGILADRIGPLPVRIVAVIGYSAGFAMLAAAPWVPIWVIVLSLGIMGIFGSGLAPSMYILASSRGRGAIDMGGIHAAGNAGYLSGLLGAGGLLAISDGMSTLSAYQIIFLIFTTMYLLLNLPAIAAMAGWRVHRPVSDTRST